MAEPSLSSRRPLGRFLALSTMVAVAAATFVVGGTAVADVGAGESRRIVLAGQHGLPAADEIGAVVLSVTAVVPTADTFLTVHPAGSARPNASNVNVAAGQVVPNMVISGLGTAGAVDVFNAAGDVELVVDVQGWFERGAFRPIGPRRLTDTRGGATVDGGERSGGPLGAGTTRTVCVGGRAGVPTSGVGAVSLNLTGVGPTESTHLTVWPAGRARPGTSSLNLAPGQTRANAVITELGANGCVSVFNARGTTHLVVDVNGWLPPSSFTAVAPARVLDTRPGGRTVDGTQVGAGPMSDNTLSLPTGGRAGLPTSGIGAVLMNVTAAASTGTGHVSVHPGGTSAPNASNLNVSTGDTAAVAVLARPANDGMIRLTTRIPGGAAHLIADVAGWIPAGAYRGLPAPRRVIDTRKESSGRLNGCPIGDVQGHRVTVDTDLPSDHPMLRWITCGIRLAHAHLPDGPPSTHVIAHRDLDRQLQRLSQYMGEPISTLRPWVTGGGAFSFQDRMISVNVAHLENAEFANDAFFLRLGLHEWHHTYAANRYARSTIPDPFNRMLTGEPRWMHEVSADWFALDLLERFGAGWFVDEFRWIGARFQAPRFPGLGAWESAEGAASMSYNVLPHIGDALVSIGGRDALIRSYYEARAQTTEPWQVTFERVFGVSVRVAYERVAEHIAQVAASAR